MLPQAKLAGGTGSRTGMAVRVGRYKIELRPNGNFRTIVQLNRFNKRI
jgi:hypothetical protein